MKILIAGGAGYIGSVVADHLVKSGYEVVVYDNLSHGYRQAVPSGVELVEGDIGDREKLKKVLEQSFGAVMHFAAFIEAGESMEKPEKYYENNVDKARVLFGEVLEAKMPYVVFSSTAAVYESKDEPLKEDDPIKPANVYGETKRVMEKKLEDYVKEGKVKAVVLRYFNAAGATLLSQPPKRGEAHVPETHLIPNIMKVALGQKEKMDLFGDDYPTPDGTCIRDYIHVDDLARAHILALEALRQGKFTYEVINLGNGRGFSNGEVIKAARKVTGHEIPVEVKPRREGDAVRLIADSGRAREVLGWEPEHKELETIIKSSWEWHKYHPQGYLNSVSLLVK